MSDGMPDADSFCFSGLPAHRETVTTVAQSKGWSWHRDAETSSSFHIRVFATVDASVKTVDFNSVYSVFIGCTDMYALWLPHSQLGWHFMSSNYHANLSLCLSLCVSFSVCVCLSLPLSLSLSLSHPKSYDNLFTWLLILPGLWYNCQ